MRFSVSQAKTHNGCNRKGYLEKVQKLPLKFADSTTRGSILHEVKERYLLADEQGLDENGEPANLYPEGWRNKTDYVRDEDGNDTDEIKQEKTITLVEAEWIKRSVQHAIDKGYLWRPPGRVVEYGFEEELLPAEGDLPPVILIGFIDLAYENTIGDHKSCKNLNWVLNDDPTSSKYLGADLQMLVYCYYWAHKRLREGHPLPETMTLEHYQHPYQDKNKKDGKGLPPKPVRVTVTWDEILIGHERIKAIAADARRTRLAAESYKDMEQNLESCGAYGGCPFRHICSGQESLEMYTDSTNYAINPEKYKRDRAKKEVKIMSAFDDIIGNVEDNDTANTAGAAPVAESKPEPTPAKEEKKSTKVDLSTCTLDDLNAKLAKLQESEESLGIDMSAFIAGVREAINAKLKAKEEADAKAKKEAEEKAAAEKAAEAKAEAEAKAKADEEAAASEAANSDKETEETEQEVPQGTEKEVETDSDDNSESTIAGSDSQDDDQGDYQPEVKSTSERAPAGVILCINCFPAKNYAKVVSLQKVYQEYAKKHNGNHAAVLADVEDIVTTLKGHVVRSQSITQNVRELAAVMTEHSKVQAFIGTNS